MSADLVTMRRKAAFDATLAGIGGALGGWAVFILVVETEHRYLLLIALIIAALVALALEYFREVVREGHAELEKSSFVPIGISIVTLVIVCELYVKAGAHIVHVASAMPWVHNALVGTRAPQTEISVWWIFIGLVGIWVYMAVGASQVLVGTIFDVDNEATTWGKRMARGALRGLLTSVVCAALAVFAVLAFRLFLLLASEAEVDDAFAMVDRRAISNPFITIVPWLLRGWHWIWNAAGWAGLDYMGIRWRALPAVAATGCILCVPYWLARHVRENGLESIRLGLAGWIGLVVTLWIIAAPILTEWQKLVAILLNVGLMWIVPGMILGAAVPLMQSISKKPGLWLAVGLVVSGLMYLGVTLQHANGSSMGIIASVLILCFGVGLGIRQQDWSPTLRSLLPLLMACITLGPFALRQELTYQLLGDLNTLLSVQPSNQRQAPNRSRVPSAERYTREVLAEVRQYVKYFEQLEVSLERVRHYVEDHASSGSGNKHAQSTHGDQHSGPPLFECVNVMVVFAETFPEDFDELVNEVDDYLRDPRAARLAAGVRVEPARNFTFDQRDVTDLRAANESLRSHIDSNRDEIVRNKNSLENLAKHAAKKLARQLELWVSVSFGFWVTLACLATWRRSGL